MSRLYGDIHRAMQMAFDTRTLADRIEAIARQDPKSMRVPRLSSRAATCFS